MCASINKLGILAGKGALPRQIAVHCDAKQLPYFILALEESLDPSVVEGREHAVISIGAIGQGLEQLKQAGVKEVVLAGHVKRPSLRSVKIDDTAKKILKKLGMKILGGDDALLRALIGFLEEEGFAVLAPHDILGGLTLPAGSITEKQPTKEQLASIDKAMHIVKQTGELDIGQSLVIEDEYVLGIEAAEGTDELIKRCAGYMKAKNHAILVKAKKPGQEERADMPTIGVDTIKQLADSHYAGLAIEADNVLVVDSEEVKALANQHGLFIIAV